MTRLIVHFRGIVICDKFNKLHMSFENIEVT